jgi:hypothetical protein
LLIEFYMVFNEINDRIKIPGWVKVFLILDIVVYLLLLLMFPNLWFIGLYFGLLIIGTIVSSLIYEELSVEKDNTWRKPAKVLATIVISLNAIFCIVISAAMIIGVYIATSHA